MADVEFTSLTGATTEARPSRTMKRGLAGAAGGIYGGPTRITGTDSENTAHISGAAAGGVEDTSGLRKVDAYALDGATGGMAGAAAEGQLLTKSNSRPTGRTAYTGEGVGGSDVTGSIVSIPGYPFQKVGQRASAKAYVFEGVTGTTGALPDQRSIRRGDVPGAALGQSFGSEFVDDTTGSPATGAGNDNKSGRAVTRAVPTVSGAATPNAGTVSVVAGVTGAIQVDLHADDITGGANGRKGCELLFVALGTDTDEDGDVIAHVTCDGGTDIASAFTGADAGTGAFYVRWRYPGNATGHVVVGPWSARGVRTIA